MRRPSQPMIVAAIKHVTGHTVRLGLLETLANVRFEDDCVSVLGQPRHGSSVAIRIQG